MAAVFSAVVSGDKTAERFLECQEVGDQMSPRGKFLFLLARNLPAWKQEFHLQPNLLYIVSIVPQPSQEGSGLMFLWVNEGRGGGSRGVKTGSISVLIICS